MCGIAGVYSHSGPPPPLPAGWIDLMARRGPDGEGEWSDHRRCILAFRRLAILDPTPRASQPMLTPDGRFALVFNGEIYNFRDLRNDLLARGVDLRSSGDTEVLLWTLVLDGTAALERLNGMFALAFYDSAEQKLVLARDRSGIKPLYVLATSAGVVFSSQYDMILRHGWAKRSLSSIGLALYLRLGHIPAPFAATQQAEMVQPGTFLEISSERIERGRYFAFPQHREGGTRGSEALETVEQAVDRAVGRQLVSDVPIGTFLSGGIDSPLVTAIAATHNPGLPAFTLSVAGDVLDEAPDARRYASATDVHHHVVSIADHELHPLLEDVVDACAEPFADYSVFPTMAISRAASRHVKVLLSGDGGDELFFGYAGRSGSVMEDTRDFAVPFLIRSLLRLLRRAAGSATTGSLEWRNIGSWYRAKHSRIPENWLIRLFPDVPPWPDAATFFDYAGHDADETAAWLRWNEFVVHMTMVLLKVDRGSMHESVEVRVPLLDNEVIDAALRVNWRSCLDLAASRGKIPLRSALNRRVGFDSDEKRGFTVPMSRWLRGPYAEVLHDCLLARDDICGLPIHRPTLIQMHRALEEGKDFGWALWTLLALSLWEQNHLRSPVFR